MAFGRGVEPIEPDGTPIARAVKHHAPTRSAG